eukprot:4931003-Pyramimonas_sp.AAC.2
MSLTLRGSVRLGAPCEATHTGNRRPTYRQRAASAKARCFSSPASMSNNNASKSFLQGSTEWSGRHPTRAARQQRVARVRGTDSSTNDVPARPPTTHK